MITPTKLIAGTTTGKADKKVTGVNQATTTILGAMCGLKLQSLDKKSSLRNQQALKNKKIMEVSKGVPTELGLSGTMADSDEYSQTLESLKSAESLSGKSMAKPSIDNNLYQSGAKGSKVEDLLSNNQRITASEIEAGMMSDEEKQAETAQLKQKEVESSEMKKAQTSEKEERAFNNLAIPHFM